MSDAREVKRWETIAIDSKIPGVKLDVDSIPRVVVVSAEDHDRVVAELKAEVARQAKVIEKLRAALKWYADATEFEISGDEIGEPLVDGVPFTTVAKSILKEIEQGEGT